MRCKTVPQRVNTTTTWQPSSFYRFVEHLLADRLVHRLPRILKGGEKPMLRAKAPPITPQLFEQSWREQRVTILSSLPQNHPDLLTARMNVFGFEPACFA